jgi:glycerol-3-phosphate acyltransferase PlsY
MTLVGLAMAGYLLGSLPFGVWVGRLVVGRDIRAGGSGHSGATNTLRQAGLGPALAVAALDLAKGFAAAWMGERLGMEPWAPAAATAGAVAGHCWPMLAGFRGGMGLGALGGAMLALSPLGFVIGLGLAIAGTLVLRHSARGNVLAGLLVGPVVWLLTRDPTGALAAGAGGLIIAVRSLSDWRRKYRELWLDRDRPPKPTGEHG